VRRTASKRVENPHVRFSIRCSPRLAFTLGPLRRTFCIKASSSRLSAMGVGSLVKSLVAADLVVDGLPVESPRRLVRPTVVGHLSR